MQTLKDFFKALNNEESKIIPILEKDNIGWILRCAVNELDLYYSNLNDPTEQEQEQLYILQIGTSRLIKLALESRGSFDAPVLTFRRQADMSMKALKIVSGLGMIQHGRRVAQTVSKGIGKIENLGENKFLITLPQDIYDDDFHERGILEHYYRESRRRFDGVRSLKEWKQIESNVSEKIYDLVYPFMDHFIGYDSDPSLDEYFFALATHEVSLQEGYDSFHYAVEFGGIRMQHYMLGLKFMISSSLRHYHCCKVLIEKHPEIRLEDILTISADVDTFVESLHDAVNYFGSYYEEFIEISIEQAKRIFEVLTYSRNSLDIIDAPGSPHPIFLRNSESGLIKSIFGARSEPVRYMLESLRFHFPKDYDKNQTNREVSFQRACRRVLNDSIQNLSYLENIKIRTNKQVLSDIDLVVLEKKTGTILLVQLKHQELYGADIHAKSIRTERLNRQILCWMDAVEEWLITVGNQGVKSTFQLDSDWPDELNIYRIALSRHYAHSLKSILDSEDVAFSNWPQFYNCNQIVKRDYPSPVLMDLVNSLKESQDKTERITHLPEPSTRWKIGHLEFCTMQEIEECT